MAQPLYSVFMKKKITFRYAFLSSNIKYNNIVDYIKESFGKEPEWNDFTKLNLINLVDYLCGKVSKSSAKTYCAMIKSVINKYSEEYKIPCKQYNDILSIRNVKCTNTWLTESELYKIINYKPATDIENNVKKMFIIGAFSGCRHSDLKRIDESNIMNNSLCYVSQKSKTQAIVPLKPLIKEYIYSITTREKSRYTPVENKNTHQWKIEEGTSEKLEALPVKNSTPPSSEKLESKEYSDVTFNKTIREICRKCNINSKIKLFKAGQEVTGEKWKFVSSHTARRSFATNIYLIGADLYSISRMMGHSSIEMTERYICCGLKDQSDKVMEYFK